MPARRLDPGRRAARRCASTLTEVDGYIWHVYLPDVRPGQRYGYRVHGPWDPAKGLWCNPAKLLLDPYAKAIDGQVDWDAGVLRLRLRRPRQAEHATTAPRTCRSAVVGDPFFDWGNDRPPRTADARDGHLRDPRAGPDDAPPGHPRAICAAPTRRSPTRR